MKNYVLGFVFNKDKSKVVLIEKTHPKEQKNKLNGIGGLVEPDEYAEPAMNREFKEETGVDIPNDQWDMFFEFTNMYSDIPEEKQINVVCFKATLDDIYQVSSMTDEKILVIDTEALMTTERLFYNNVKFLILMAMDENFLNGSGNIR